MVDLQSNSFLFWWESLWSRQRFFTWSSLVPAGAGQSSQGVLSMISNSFAIILLSHTSSIESKQHPRTELTFLCPVSSSLLRCYWPIRLLLIPPQTRTFYTGGKYLCSSTVTGYTLTYFIMYLHNFILFISLHLRGKYCAFYCTIYLTAVLLCRFYIKNIISLLESRS